MQRETEALNLMGRVFEYVYKNYVDEVDPQKISEAAVRGMLSELDEHSQYLPPQNYEDLMMSTEGEFGGLGITIVIRDHYPTVVSPIEGTPAFFMGIQGGDQIVDIEGQTTFDWTSDQAVKLLRGEPGTRVSLKIRREGAPEPLPFTITRDIIKVESVPYAFMIGDVGYVRIQNFSRTTAAELRTKLERAREAGREGDHARPALESRRPAHGGQGGQRAVPRPRQAAGLHEGAVCSSRTSPTTASRAGRCTTSCP